MEGAEDRIAERNFVLMQGFQDTSPAESAARFTGLMWQPRVTLLVLLVGIATQRWELFAAVAAFLWWNAIAPRLNPFEAIYNRVLAAGGRPRLLPAPPPRRFAQGMAGTFCLAIAVSLYSGWHLTAYVLEGMLVCAMIALAFFRFCLGSYVFHLLTGNFRFANQTLPWSRPAVR